MIDALIVSNVILWIAVVALCAVVLALMRQVGVLHERIAPAGALVGAAGPRTGEAAPVLEIADWSGRAQTIGGPTPDGRATLLVFVSPSCPVCKVLIPIAESVAASEGARLVFASDGPRAEHEELVRAHGLDRHPYLLSTRLGLAFHVEKLPHAVLIGADGVIRARGLVNSREHLESLFHAGEAGVASVQEYVRRQAPAASPSAVHAGGADSPPARG